MGQGHWVTLEDDQRVYIGSHGEFMARGPTAKTAGGKAPGGSLRSRQGAEKRRATIAKKKADDAFNAGREDPAVRASRIQESLNYRTNPAPKPAPAATTAAGPVKSGPQALRDYYAAKSKGGEELSRAKHELLRTKLDMERRQVAATAAASKPAAPAPRSERANYAKPEVAYKAGQMHADVATARKELAAEKAHQRFREAAKAEARVRLDAANAGLAKRAAATQPAAKTEPAFSLLQRSATRSSPSPVNTGRGTTKFMFDMNKKDLKGQTSMFDRHAKGKP